tara:strand:- start:310 stop:597 length:288 start_codon:yes stop_codon:yes gene_type:complete
MSEKGYWINCTPVSHSSNENFAHDLYNASIDNFPEMSVTAASPDMAVQKLRDKLAKVKKYYELTGRTLPQKHNRLMPNPKKSSSGGWMSIYIDIE